MRKIILGMMGLQQDYLVINYTRVSQVINVLYYGQLSQLLQVGHIINILPTFV